VFNIKGNLRVLRLGYLVASVSWLSTSEDILSPDRAELPNYERSELAQP